MDHLQVRGTCFSCHNGVKAMGKNPGHIASDNNCDACHTTNAFTPVRLDHNSIAMARQIRNQWRGGLLPHLPYRCSRSGSAAQPRADDSGLQRMPRDTVVDPCPLQSHGPRGQLSELPQRRRRDRKSRQPHDDFARLLHVPPLPELVDGDVYSHVGGVSGRAQRHSRLHRVPYLEHGQGYVAIRGISSGMRRLPRQLVQARRASEDRRGPDLQPQRAGKLRWCVSRLHRRKADDHCQTTACRPSQGDRRCVPLRRFATCSRRAHS